MIFPSALKRLDRLYSLVIISPSRLFVSIGAEQIGNIGKDGSLGGLTSFIFIARFVFLEKSRANPDRSGKGSRVTHSFRSRNGRRVLALRMCRLHVRVTTSMNRG